MELTLTTEEREFLLNILEHRRREIAKEISHTDNRDFRQVLRKNEKLIDAILNQLHGVPHEMSA